ncbi:MAG: sulfur carrier protein ThiS adenylyltransferase ThiF [Bacteroidales bacterium]
MNEAIFQLKAFLSGKTVGIAGAGGLGSNCAVALARTGVGKIIVADFDVLEASNLNRQYYFRNQLGIPKVLALKENIRRIDPDIKVEAVIIKIGRDNIQQIFGQCDVLIEAFDKAEMKQMLIETALEIWPNRPLVAASGLAGWGNTESITVKRFGNFVLVGDDISETSPWNPPLGPKVSVVAGIQADVALEFLLCDFTFKLSEKP